MPVTFRNTVEPPCPSARIKKALTGRRTRMRKKLAHRA
jgi:hypothetical protein